MKENNIFKSVVDNRCASAESKTVLVIQLLLIVTPLVGLELDSTGLNS